MAMLVSVIVPCYNGVNTIRGLLEAIRAQTFPQADMEIIIADGRSTDGTRETIEAFSREHPELRIKTIDNPHRTIPSGLNIAIQQARGEIILRLDAHSAPEPDYVQLCLETLQRTQAANVGGVWEIRSPHDNWIGRSIAAAAAHPLGAGDARYRVGGVEGPVDTVPFGAYRREWLERVGHFNEDLLSNEDYEFNFRLRALGGLVWFNPAIRCVYYTRSSLSELTRQYVRYGFWKARMIRRYVRSIQWRQVGPPLFAGSTLFLLGASVVWRWARTLLALEWAGYGLLLGSVGLVQAIRKRDFGMVLGFPLAIATMHLSWGLGFLVGVITKQGRTTAGNRQA
jgi:glycosyltransferase involved in cell wall biosynthesis